MAEIKEGNTTESKMKKIGQLSFCLDGWFRRGRFGSVFVGRFNNSLKVAVKKLEKEITVDSSVYLKVNGHSNIVEYYATEGSDNAFV